MLPKRSDYYTFRERYADNERLLDKRLPVPCHACPCLAQRYPQAPFANDTN
jgi:hypothetical protein